MPTDRPTFIDGDRVRATQRRGFPHGTVMRVLERGFVLVRWDGDVLETAHQHELTKLDSNGT
jgi:hypothetical protein